MFLLFVYLQYSISLYDVSLTKDILNNEQAYWNES